MNETKKTFACKLTAKVIFPQGAAPGAGISSNIQILSRNGKQEPVLRGTALAGVLRSAYAEKQGLKPNDKDNDNNIVARWFGSKANDDSINNSCVEIADMLIKCTSENKTAHVNARTHNMINRHTGAASKRSLFSIETLPPDSHGKISITIKQNENENEETKTFVSQIVEIIAQGLLIGGSSNRGIGEMIPKGDIYEESFDLNTLEGMAAFMDAQYLERKNGVMLQGEVRKTDNNELKRNDGLKVKLELGIPRGEDLVVGDGQEGDYTLQPQCVTFGDETEHWRIPGSSLRGIIRNWMTRLAAREGEKLRDSADEWFKVFNNNDDPSAKYTKSLGWGFIDKEKDKDKWEQYKKEPDKLKDPILDLFGSLYKRGRIHITDGFSRKVKDSDTQKRMHVAIDRFTGGANEGALFKNKVLTGENLRFPITIILQKPKKQEIEWLKKTLLALHLGILHVGSSKGGGRLEIKSISAEGNFSEILTEAKELN
jgi:CRISPR/Cas system CSM-associated protein Csm3 (group 7 of RAMP superfamily)